jgi:hypothetical protein
VITVVALSATRAAIESPSGAVVTYRRNLQAR